MPLRLHSRVYGTGEPLVILHGLFGSGRNWASLAKRFADHYQVVTVDLRNHGDSPHAATMTYPEMAADLRVTLDDVGIDRARLLGHSMGGKTAMWFALRWPERVARLLVADIAPVAYAHDHDELVAAMLAVDLSALTRRDEVDARLRERVPEVGLRQFLLTNLASRHGHLLWRVNLEAIGHSMPQLTGFPTPDGMTTPYSGPTLFLGGSHSHYILPRYRPRIDELFPNASLDTIAGAGHWLHAERPQAFLDAALSFFGRS